MTVVVEFFRNLYFTIAGVLGGFSAAVIPVIEFLNRNIFWGIPMLLLILVSGCYLTFITKGVIFRRFGTVMKYTLKTIFKRNKVEDAGAITPFQAVSTALAATVGTGNIVGVAVAIQTGGPGAIFWMLMAALLGMVTKYAEVTLSVAYRVRNADGNFTGGPMYYITKGLGKKWLAVLFCLFGSIASFGIGNMVQANSLSGGVQASFGISPWITGLVITVLAGLVLIGGIKRISKVAEILVPFMAVLYIIGTLIVLVVNSNLIPAAVGMIVSHAFTGTAAGGGFLGASIMYGARIGVARGVFTNEAGLGSAPIAHATAETDHPARQGLWGAFEVFFDTIVMCFMTALVIITSGLWNAAPMLSGNALAQTAFSNAFAGGGYVVSVGLVLFAFATIIAWYYYGEKCVEFIAGAKGIQIYRLFFVLAIYIGSVAKLTVVWELADLLNGLMAVPNLIALIALSPVIRNLSNDFFADPHRIRPKNEDFTRLLILKNQK